MNIFPFTPNWRQVLFRRKRPLKLVSVRTFLVRAFLATGVSAIFFPAARAQQTRPAQSVVVQPGAPGTPSKTLPPSTRATLPPRSAADVEFMQGMILHHTQAVEMTALIQSHTQNKDLGSLGARISTSQSDKIPANQIRTPTGSFRVETQPPITEAFVAYAESLQCVGSPTSESCPRFILGIRSSHSQRLPFHLAWSGRSQELLRQLSTSAPFEGQEVDRKLLPQGKAH
jgi:Domain of unknown function (DUF305)